MDSEADDYRPPILDIAFPKDTKDIVPVTERDARPILPTLLFPKTVKDTKLEEVKKQQKEGEKE